jgi:hypothetical protein
MLGAYRNARHDVNRLYSFCVNGCTRSVSVLVLS